MVSWVNSNFNAFGSGITVPKYGFILHNRGALFTLNPRSPNIIKAHKRPFNTLSAGFVMHGGQPLMTVTLMGGDMQAQGHAQTLVDILDLGANLQASADMARFRHSQVSNTLSLETPLYDVVGAKLTAMGHSVRAASGEEMGGVQVLMYVHDADVAHAETSSSSKQVAGYYRSGSDFRKDGEAVGW
jgi:gamma-glutamyltranspeptidase/glutathione hydrolase